MSIANEIARLQGVKTDILAAIAAKGVTVPAGSALDDCPALIASIPTGGGNIPDGYKLTMYTEIADNGGGATKILPKFYGQDDVTPYRYDSLEYQVYLKQNVSSPQAYFNFDGSVNSNYKRMALYAVTTQGSESINCNFQFRDYFNKMLTINGTVEGFTVTRMSYDGTNGTFSLNDTTDSSSGALSNDALTGIWQLFNVVASDYAGTKIFRMSSKIYNSDKYRFDYVPTRRLSDNRAGFINLVTGNFVWAKDAPTNLIAGPDIT